MLTELGLSAFNSSQVSALDPLAAWDQVFLGASLLLSPGAGLNAFQDNALVPIIELDESPDSLLEPESLPLELNLQDNLLSFTKNSHSFTAPVSVPRLTAIASSSQAFHDQLTGWQETAPLVGESTDLNTINSSSLSSSSLPPDQAGNSRQEARNLGFLDATPNSQTFFDGVGVGDKKDFYRFNLLSASEFELTLNGLSANANVFLEDANGNLVASSENEGTASESIIETLESGTYYLLVRSDSEETNSTSYSLNLSAQFSVDEAIVSNPSIPLPDPEFDAVGYRITWQDKDNNLWVAPIDSSTGNLLLEDSQLLDTGLAPIPSYGKRTGTGNGPEWIYSQEGSQILYTKLIDGETVLGRTQGTGTNLVTELMPDSDLLPWGENGLTPLGSLDSNDGSPRVLYLLPTPPGPSTLAWRDFDQPIGGIISETANSFGRWVDGKSESISFVSEVDGFNQVFQYDIDTDTLTQLTFSETHKDDPFIWNAPELNDEPVLVTAESDDPTSLKATSLGIYRYLDGEWIKFNELTPPTELSYIRSAEPFVYNGKSYISLLAENSKKESSEIWIAGIDPNFEFYRQVSNPDILMVRNDPEFFMTEAGAFIYYTERGSGVVYQADTGLGLPDGAGNTLADALDIGFLDTTPVPQTFSDWVGLTDKRDFYRFELQATSHVQLSLEGLSDNANIFIGDASGNKIASSSNEGDTPESLAGNLEPGTYHVLVQAASESNSTSYDLTLSAEFVPDDDIVSSPILSSMLDPEFDQVGFQVTWQDLEGNLWVAPVAPNTGDFILNEAVIIDTGLAPLAVSIGGTSNGPEWVYSQDGSQIVYTKLINNQFVLGRAHWTGSEWEVGILDGTNGFAPLGSKNPNDAHPSIIYFKDTPLEQPRILEWQELNQQNGGTVPYTPVFPGQWVQGEQSIILPIWVDGFKQIALYNINTMTLTQLTFSDTHKKNPFMWHAPEFNNELVFMAAEFDPETVEAPTEVAIYRNLNGEWVKIKTIAPPSAWNYTNLPQPFVYNGQSYIAMLVAENPLRPANTEPAELWISTIEPEFEFYRKVSHPQVIPRFDPEPLITEEGVFIYYTAKDEEGDRIIHRADTGLATPNLETEPVDVVSGSLTSIHSSSESMISYRHQEHMWMTDDDALHVIVKQGRQEPTLGLYSSFDQGQTWQTTQVLPDSGARSTSDGVMIGQNLYLVYSSSNGGIELSQLQYDNTTQEWNLVGTRTVTQEPEVTASNPTLTVDNSNRVWVTFASLNETTQQTSLNLLYSDDRGMSWQDPGITLVPPSSSERKSTRLITSSQGVGVIYSHDNTLNWAYRKDSWSPDTPWEDKILFQYEEPLPGDARGSHFSVVVDELDNIHVVTNDDHQLVYLKFDQQERRWEDPKILGSAPSAIYMQISITSEGRLLITYDVRDNNETYLNVLESTDHGETFHLSNTLEYRLGLDTGNPRIETPGIVTSTLPVLQQVSHPSTDIQGLVYFNVNL